LLSVRTTALSESAAKAALLPLLLPLPLPLRPLFFAFSLRSASQARAKGGNKPDARQRR
jgi:hypothetical protein